MNPAIPCPPTLDGVHLVGADAQEWRIRPMPARTLVELSDHGAREFLRWPGPARPQKPVKFAVSFDWEHVGNLRDTVAELLSVPGVHELVIWRHVESSWACDGQRDEFELPWRLATHVLGSAPGGLSLDRFAPRVKVGIAGAWLTPLAKSQVDYDAGTPGAGEVWFLQGGQVFKLEAAPLAGAVVFAHVVPVLRMLEGDAEEGRYRNPMAEPRVVNFHEAAG